MKNPSSLLQFRFSENYFDRKFSCKIHCLRYTLNDLAGGLGKSN